MTKNRSSLSKALSAKPGGTRRAHRRTRFPVPTPPPPPTPILSHPTNGEAVVPVKVLATPEKGKKRVWVWVVDEAPRRRLGYGQLIDIQSANGSSGPGLLSTITDLRQHWVTWTVSGGPEPCYIRVPVPWTSMNGVEAIAHARLYPTLPSDPPPHRDAQPPPAPSTSVDTPPLSPYDYDPNETERARLEDRLHAITEPKWTWRPEEERGQRRRR